MSRNRTNWLDITVDNKKKNLHLMLVKQETPQVKKKKKKILEEKIS